MGIAAHHQIAGQGKALLRQNLVADAPVDVEKVRNALLGHKGADVLMVLGEFLVGCRHTMVENNDVPVGIIDFSHADLLEGFGNRRGVVVTHGNIGLDFNDLAGDDVLARFLSQYLFCEGLSHTASLPVTWFWLTNYNKSK
ncbi:MAG: hypothetical protein BWY77_00961 [bacterium ADurb.Bin431]|nr:MAG: hypothetical protein BWY77_00961 [bacterium ADurb.Bin431]